MVEHTPAEDDAIGREAESLAAFLATADPASPAPLVRRYGQA
jgi:hypothetical protein